MSSFIVTLLFLFGICNRFANGDLPSEIEKCKSGDAVCIAKILPFILQKYTNGIPEIGLSNVEQLSLNDVVIAKASPESAVALNLEFKKLYLHGLSNLTVQKIVGFEKDIRNSKFEVYVTIPNLVVDGDYVSSGKMLILPMDGEGYANIQLKNTSISLKFKLDEYQQDGKQFARIKDLKCKTVPKLMHVKFDNLFNGNEVLGNSLNQLINENWQTVWSDMESQVNESVMIIVKRLLKNVLQNLPYEEFYRKD